MVQWSFQLQIPQINNKILRKRAILIKEMRGDSFLLVRVCEWLWRQHEYAQSGVD